jgi:hypothetical protein
MNHLEKAVAMNERQFLAQPIRERAAREISGH